MAGAGATAFPRELVVQRIQSLVEEGFWDALRRLKLDVLGTDDSPLPITARLGYDRARGVNSVLTLWTDSDNPAPGAFSMEIDPRGQAKFDLLAGGTHQYWTTGVWDGEVFENVPVGLLRRRPVRAQRQRELLQLQEPGYYTPRQRRPMASFFNLRSESLVQPSHNSVGDRNNCPISGTLINTNNMRGFQNLDREQLLKAEAKKILHGIVSCKVEEDPSVLLRFLVTSFADLKNWKVYYNVAFPSLVFNSRMTLLNLQPASKALTKEEAASMYTSLQKWRASSETTVIPFFLVSISSDSFASIRQLKDWKDCQGNYRKILFGFYDHGCRSDCPGWVIRNYVAFLSIRWKIEKVQFFCYREYKGNPDLEQSLIGEASFPSPCGWDDPDFLPDAIGWEGINPGKGTKEMKPKEIDLQSMNPASQDEEKQLMHLKLMGWRHFPVNIDKLSHVRVLLLGAGTLGCEVARLLMTWGVRKLTVVDSNSVATSDLVKQSLYIDKDCGVPRVTAIVPHLKERCPAVEVEGIQMEIPVPGHPVSSSKMASVLDDCKHLQTLVAANDAVFLLTDTLESRWLPTLLCASENKIAISAVLGCDSYLVMRHGAGPGTSRGTHEVISQIENLSTEDARGHQRLGCCFCNDVASLIKPIPYETLPGLTSVVSGKAVELFARMLHHPDEIHAPGDTAGMETEHQLGLLPHQLRGSLPKCGLSMELSNSSVNCTACSVAVLSEYRRRGLDFVMQAINYPTYLKDFTGISDLKRPDTCTKIPTSISVISDKISDVRCLLLGAGTLGCDVARILMDCGVRKLTVVDSGRVVVSNLARQSLYTSDDRGVPKATAILRHLVERCPSVDAEGIKMEIPMPGHPVSPTEAAGVLQDCERLKKLVASHDAIFLLTDTRESRWLPTLLCTNENKIAITTALGYDSYLVMRHGAGPGTSYEASNVATAIAIDKLSTEDALGRQRLGCYFCSDVIAPVDSVSNRTLDQQCTVTRPGLASIASGRAADLFRRMLHHPDGIHAPGEIAGTSSEHEYGLLPHQMRGSLSQYNLLTLLGYSSSNCTACSNAVLSEYRRRGMDFVMQVINEPTYLEDLTGLTDLMKSASDSQVEWVDETDEDDFVEV